MNPFKKAPTKSTGVDTSAVKDAPVLKVSTGLKVGRGGDDWGGGGPPIRNC